MNSSHDTVLMVIPSINGGKLLARMLPTLQFAPSSVVVIDQGSSDDTAEVCARAGVEVQQLGHPHSYTQACNIGADLARQRDRPYLCVSNNDITFRTDVMGAMHAAMEQDPGLGIVAPAQIVCDEARDDRPLAYRVFWNLTEMQFLHDVEPRDGAVQRLEADFCELTCALVRMSAVEAIGFLDDEYGFYHEDADFGFRLRKAGYNCAYLPNAQIEHFISSTVSREKAFRKQDYIEKNKRHFARKHLGFAVGQNLPQPDTGRAPSLRNQGVQACLDRYGLVARGAPELAISHAHVAPRPDAYLYTSLEAGPNLPRWAAAHRELGAVFTTSVRTRDLLAGEGIAHCFYVPMGIDPDTFHPWGPARRLHDEVTTYLAVVHGQQFQLLRAILRAWHRFSPSRAARLVLSGPGLGGCIGRRADSALRVGNVEVLRYDAEGIDIHDMLRPRSASDLALLYRSADYVIVGARGEDSALAALQSVACGVPCLVVDPRGMAEFSAQAAVATDHLAAEMSDASDRLLALLQATLRSSAQERDGLVAAGLIAVRRAFTVRATAMGLHHALSQLQIRRPSRVLARLERRQLEDRADELTLTRPRPSFGAKTARQIGTLGRVTEQFGSVWHDKGFADAARTVGKELGYFLAHRLGRVPRVANTGLRRFGADDVRPPPKPGSVLLIGYIDAQLGLGQSLRGLALALSRTTVPFGIYPLSSGVEGRRSMPYMPEQYDMATPHAVNIVEVAVSELLTVLAEVGQAHFDRSYNVLRTYWELSQAPREWRPLLDGVDELWVPDAFVGASFRPIFDRTITIVPPCVDPEPPEPSTVRPFGLAQGVFYFIFSFDYFSFPQRKNPLGVIRAFRRAFPDNPQVGLIIKSTASAEHYPELRNEMRVIAQDDSRIRLIDEELTRREMLALLAAADCYVSLHRSEGFGLGMAEAMALGKPVIGTDYSGSTDFLREDTSYPVPYTLTPVRPHEYLHTEGQVWAEPDEAACAEAMTRVVGNPAEVAAKTAAARRFVTGHYGPDAVAGLVADRLTAIFAHGGLGARS